MFSGVVVALSELNLVMLTEKTQIFIAVKTRHNQEQINEHFGTFLREKCPRKIYLQKGLILTHRRRQETKKLGRE